MDQLPDWWPRIAGPPPWAQEAIAYFETLWSQGVFGMTYGQIFTVVGVLLLALLVRGLFARTVVRAITRAAAGTKTNLDDALVKSISEPLKLVPIIIGVYIAINLIELAEETRIIADMILSSLVAVSIFWTLSRAAGAFSFVLGTYEKSLGWMTKTLQILFLAMGLAAVLEIWGVPILPVLGGLGVFGVALAFGAQDLFKNLISGIFILVEKRFVPGEWIQVEGVVEGTVEHIGFRSTTVRQFDKAPVYVPNGLFSDRAVINFSRMTHRRIKWAIGLEYRTTVAQLKYVCDELEAYLEADGAFAKPPEAPLLVNVDSFNESSIDLSLTCFTRTTRWDEWMGHKERLAFKVMEIVKAAGTDFAFPSRTLYVQEADKPEVFEPPALTDGARRIREQREGANRPRTLSGRGDDASEE
jgi:MscS family membrane protein